MTGFEPWISAVGRDRSTNCATTTDLVLYLFKYILINPTYVQMQHFHNNFTSQAVRPDKNRQISIIVVQK